MDREGTIGKARVLDTYVVVCLKADVNRSHSSLKMTVLPCKEYLLFQEIVFIPYNHIFRLRAGQTSECAGLSACLHEQCSYYRGDLELPGNICADIVVE